MELTVIGKGPVIRAEARSNDKYVAFDQALDHLLTRLRRAKEKRMVHHGRQRQESLSELSASGFSDIDVTPASVEVLRSVARPQKRGIPRSLSGGKYSPHKR